MKNLTANFTANATFTIENQQYNALGSFNIEDGEILATLIVKHQGETVLYITGDEFGVTVDNRFGTSSRMTTGKPVKTITELLDLAESITREALSFG